MATTDEQDPEEEDVEESPCGCPAFDPWRAARRRNGTYLRGCYSCGWEEVVDEWA